MNEMNDKEMEGMLRQLPLVKVPASLDEKILRMGRRRIWPVFTIGGTLAAAAVALIVLGMGLLRPAGNGSDIAKNSFERAIISPPPQPGFTPEQVEFIEKILSDKTVNTPNGTVRQVVKMTTERTHWVDKNRNLHIVTEKPHEQELILIPVKIK